VRVSGCRDNLFFAVSAGSKAEIGHAIESQILSNIEILGRIQAHDKAPLFNPGYIHKPKHGPEAYRKRAHRKINRSLGLDDRFSDIRARSSRDSNAACC
jgi:hypothetical protein